METLSVGHNAVHESQTETNVSTWKPLYWVGGVAASLEGGQALDAVNGLSDPSAIRSLGDGYILIYQSIGCILLALFSAAVGYATLGTGVLPRWTGWIAYAAAILNLVAVPIGLSIAPVAILTVAVIADFPLQIWLLIISIVMIRGEETAVSRTPVYGS
jgi:hypothetical protein